LIESPWKFYDVVLFNDSLESLGRKTDPFNSGGQWLDPAGWKVVCDPAKLVDKAAWPSDINTALPKDEVGKVLKDMRGVLVNVMGGFNRGKTWLLDQLCNCSDEKDEANKVRLPIGTNISTRGISAKHTVVNSQDLLLVRVEGASKPLHSCSRQDMTMASIEQYFLTSVASQLCDNFLFVVGKMTREDQKDLLNLRQLCQSGKEKKFYVVHNFKDVKTEEDFNYHIEEVIALLGAIEADNTTDAWVSRKAGTVFTHKGHGKGRISEADGDFVRVVYQ
jgi:hypothetical protein